MNQIINLTPAGSFKFSAASLDGMQIEGTLPQNINHKENSLNLTTEFSISGDDGNDFLSRSFTGEVGYQASCAQYESDIRMFSSWKSGFLQALEEARHDWISIKAVSDESYRASALTFIARMTEYSHAPVNPHAPIVAGNLIECDFKESARCKKTISFIVSIQGEHRHACSACSVGKSIVSSFDPAITSLKFRLFGAPKVLLKEPPSLGEAITLLSELQKGLHHEA